MSATAIATVKPERTGRVMLTREAISQENEQREILREYVNKHMVAGEDYGIIPGTSKPTLLKPGAEKLTALFHCVPRFKIIKEVCDWDKGLFAYRIRCLIRTSNGDTVAEGLGSCSTWEAKYRFRRADRSCPVCGKATIMRSKYADRDNPEADKGWFCYAKNGGCGTNFAYNTPAIQDQQTGRIDNPEIYDADNTVLKMAKKRAHVDAALMLSRCSDIFTQDVEDMHDAGQSADPPKTQETNKPAPQGNGQPPKTQAKPAPQEKPVEYAKWKATASDPMPTKEQFLETLAAKGWTIGEAITAINEKWHTKYEYGKTVFEKINPPQVIDIDSWLYRQPDAQKKQPAPQEQTATTPAERTVTGEYLPRNGWELYGYVTKQDAELTKAGLCKLSDLVAWIVKAGAEAGFKPVDITEWNKEAEIRAVLGWCDTFKADRERDAAARNPKKTDTAAEPIKAGAGELVT